MSRKLTIQQMQVLAAQYEGKCISKQYESSSTPLEWECKHGHRFMKQPVKVKIGQWCMECSGHIKKYTLEDAIETAKFFEGKLLTSDFKGGSQKLEWICKSGHHFKRSLVQIKHKNAFCSRCNIGERAKTQRLGIVTMQEVARSRGGKCLSNDYLDAHTLLKWQCIDGHVWEAKPNSIISSSSWCPKCKNYINISEERCRFIFERLTGKPFKSSRSIIKGQELDGYNDELKIGFEHHGKQHYDFDSFFHCNSQGLENILTRDSIKIEKCIGMGISIITIPYSISNNDENLVSFIFKELIKNGAVVEQYQIKNFSFDGFYQYISRLNQLQQLALEFKEKLLSTVYLGNKGQYLFECENGHQFFKRPNDIKSYNQWCIKCKKI
ncbi:hypothetical protein E8L90_13260 [Brevibacillus antibioticus]|uniref:Zinc-ribbon domain-containing protein n=1 Tax=Brevibacillus antibioticus TaxID=2570228 RepID=A0A4U2Y8Z2_9BACL|nr:zinc-ribbon domain-containing protein [Brevibacillus antibioticus]TKI56352.1 hypothetical protein E8L90_13260 [Brevibacillus antibioticus]